MAHGFVELTATATAAVQHKKEHSVHNGIFAAYKERIEIGGREERGEGEADERICENVQLQRKPEMRKSQSTEEFFAHNDRMQRCQSAQIRHAKQRERERGRG